MKKFAFTLAEVLITLGIIGIVAAITMPTLIANHRAIEMQSRFKTGYSLISQAIEKMRADGISTDPNDYPSNTFQPVFITYFKGAKDCGTFHNSKDSFNCPRIKKIYKNYTNTDYATTSVLDDGQFVLNNGMLIMIDNQGPGTIHISIDINGVHKPPNRWGYDLFTFKLLNEKLIPLGASRDAFPTDIYCSITNKNNFNGIGCSSKALSEVDYFKKHH